MLLQAIRSHTPFCEASFGLGCNTAPASDVNGCPLALLLYAGGQTGANLDQWRVAPASVIVARPYRATVAIIKPGRAVRSRNRNERAGTQRGFIKRSGCGGRGWAGGVLGDAFYSATIKGGSGEPRKVFCGEYTNRNCNHAGADNILPLPLLRDKQRSEWRARARLHLRANTRSGTAAMLTLRTHYLPLMPLYL